MSRHRCPPWCHVCPKCPDENGKPLVMPYCHGATMGTDNRGCLARCTCQRSKVRTVYKNDDPLEDRVKRLEKIVDDLCKVIETGKAKGQP